MDQLLDQFHFYYPADSDLNDPSKSKSVCLSVLRQSAQRKIDPCGPDLNLTICLHTDQRDLTTQLVISASLGLSAFVTFGFLRPRWSSLYAARKKQIATASSLPDLPDTFFGWMPVLYRISEKEVLTAAGLDAWVVCEWI